ncbi:MAG TPA: histidine kinase [Longimicrobiaceae bacterium]|nr:histidine kinase [Longimicrobiaceae bacterium]
MTRSAPPAPAARHPHGPLGFRVRPLALLGAWTVVGTFFGARRYINGLLFGNRVTELEPLLSGLADAYLWAFMTLPIFWLAQRIRISRRRWVVPVLVHLLVAIVASLISIEFNRGVWNYLHPEDPSPFPAYFRATFYFNIQWYAVLVGISYALDYYRRYRDREVQAARLNAELTQAQLEALKMQIQPHFLFNTLHSISELVHEDPDAADRMIIRLGDLLRLTVDNAGTQEVALRQEMQFLQAYLEIQQTRFQDTLTVRTELHPDAMDALVPNLLLQPLVENAIRHGTARQGGRGHIEIVAAREDGTLRLEVRDNGPGLAAPQPGQREGVGLRNTRARLEQLYGDAHRFEVRNREGGGVVAQVVIPFRTAGEPVAALYAEAAS